MLPLKSPRDGVITKLDAASIGEAIRALGGGRLRLEDKIDPQAAIRLRAKTGDRVRQTDTVMEIYYNDCDKLKEALKYLADGWSVGEKAERQKLIMDSVF